MQFFETFSSFPNEIDKKSKFKTFTGSSLTLSAWRFAHSGTRACRGQSPLSCTHDGRACKEQRSFEENLMNFLKMLVLTPNMS